MTQIFPNSQTLFKRLKIRPNLDVRSCENAANRQGERESVAAIVGEVQIPAVNPERQTISDGHAPTQQAF